MNFPKFFTPKFSRSMVCLICQKCLQIDISQSTTVAIQNKLNIMVSLNKTTITFLYLIVYLSDAAGKVETCHQCLQVSLQLFTFRLLSSINPSQTLGNEILRIIDLQMIYCPQILHKLVTTKICMYMVSPCMCTS